MGVAFICDTMKDLLEVDLVLSDISDIYSLGRSEKSPIKLELVSHLKKRDILQNSKELKGSKIYISNDLTKKQREECKLLRKHLIRARIDTTDLCYIRGNKL